MASNQAAVEMLSTYAFALIILVLLAAVIYVFTTIPSTIPPNQCGFSGYISCKDVVLGSNSLTTRAVFLFSNSQQYAIENATATINITGVGSYTSSVCNPKFVLPGGDLECVINFNKEITKNQLTSGDDYLSANVCTQPSSQTACKSPVQQSFGGTFTAHISPLVPPPGCSITLTAANSTESANGSGDLLTANVKILGYNIAGATVNFTSNSATVSISPSLANTNTDGNVQSYASSTTQQTATITASFGNCTASVPIIFAKPVYITFSSNTVNTGQPIVKIDGSWYSSLPKRIVALSGSIQNYTYNSSIAIALGSRYFYNSISGCGATARSGTLTAAANCTVLGSYYTQYYLTTGASGHGSAYPISGWYNLGSQINLTEVANTGYSFLSWTGSGPGNYTGVSTSPSIIIRGPVSETANFKINSYSVNAFASPSGSGTVTGGGTYNYSTPATIMATPIGMNALAGWKCTGSAASSCPTGNQTSFTFSVTSGATINATFIRILASPTISAALSGNGLITVGSSETDSATLASGDSPTGTIIFYTYTNSACTSGQSSVSTSTVLGNGVYGPSSSKSYDSAGTYYWDAVYSGDSNNNPATSKCQVLTVNKTSVSLSATLANAGSITAGSSETDSATLSGGVSPTGTITFYTYTNSACTSGQSLVSTSTVSRNGGYGPSSSVQYSTAGTYYWDAVYSGDSNNNAATSTCQVLTVNKASISLTTTLANAGSINVGTSESDSATLSGGTSPTGTIKFYTYTNSACTTGQTSEGALAVSGDTTYSPSNSVTYSTAGTYYWNAVYSGDSNNNAATSPCETLTVNNLASPSLSTTLANGGSIKIGSSETDSATLSGGNSPTGTIKFYTYTNSACTYGQSLVSTSTASGDNTYGPSSSVQYSTAGTYYWNAVYSGDSNNNAATSQCEILTVTSATPSLSTTLANGGSIKIGSSETDSATLSGGTSPTGTITFYTYTNSACTAGQTSEGTSTASGDNTYGPSSSVQYSTAGTYYWDAVYSGDSNNNAATSQCEILLVNNLASPSLSTTLANGGSINVGSSETDSATLSGGNSPTGTITFYTYTNSACTAGQTSEGTSTASGDNTYGPSSSVQYSTAGTYYWDAVYSGDSNNNPATSPCETLTVNTVYYTLTETANPINGGAVGCSNCSGGGVPAGCTECTFSVSVPSGTVVNLYNIPNTGYTYTGWTGTGTRSYTGTSTGAVTVTMNGDITEVANFQAIPSLTTTLANGGAINVGASETDSATLSGGNSPTGTIKFYTYTNSACTSGQSLVSTSTVSGNGGYSPSGSVQYNTAGTYYWNAVYSGDSNNLGTTSSCETLIVNNLASPSLSTTLARSGSINVGSSETDSATLSGGNSPTGTIKFYTYTNSACTSGQSLVSTSTASGDNTYGPSSSVQYSTAGTYYWNAVYSGDSNNNGETSACEVLTVNNLASPSLTTTLANGGTINIGASESDSATLSGGNSPTGTITFYTYTNSACTVSQTSHGTSTVSGNGGYGPSSAVIYPDAGTYYWNAVYSGDSNNNPATSPCEALTVNPSSPSLSATLANAGAITAGSSETDSATLSAGTSPTGTITFYTYTDSACTSGQSLVSTSTVSGNGGYGPSSPVQYSTAGTYYWDAVYSGDSNNNPATSTCQVLTVNKASSSLLSTTLANGGSITAGSSETDSAILSGGVSPTGTITFYTYTDSACTSGQSSVSTSAVSGNGGYGPSSSVQYSTAGTYYWNAVYSGDSNNNGVTSPCETLTVNMQYYTLTEIASPNVGAVGCGNCSGAGSGTSGTFTVSLPAGTKIPLYETPNSGYIFSIWSGTGPGSYSSSEGGTPLVILNGNVVETGSFYEPKLTLIGNQNEGAVGTQDIGTSSPCTNCEVSGLVPAGTVLNLYNTPNSGYLYSGWMGTGPGSYTGTSTGAITITVNGNITETADFYEPTLTEIASPAAGGAVGCSNCSGAGSGTSGTFSVLVPAGTKVPLWDISNPGYVFDGWLGTGTGNYTGTVTNPSPLMTIEGDITEIANFQTQPSYSVTATASPSGDGTVTGSGSYVSGSTATISESPTTGYTFTGWTCTGSASSSCPSGTGTTSFSFTVTSAATETATFTQLPPAFFTGNPGICNQNGNLGCMANNPYEPASGAADAIEAGGYICAYHGYPYLDCVSSNAYAGASNGDYDVISGGPSNLSSTGYTGSNAGLYSASALGAGDPYAPVDDVECSYANPNQTPVYDGNVHWGGPTCEESPPVPP